MRLLLTGNSPFCQTGYGIQPAQLALQLKALGHEPAIFAYYGLNGGMIEWRDIPVYPNPGGDYGAEWAGRVYNHFKADCIITLIDAWIMGAQSENCKWFPWTPVDHDPMPPKVYGVLRNHKGIYKPIAMSRFGERQMVLFGIDCFYVPHMIDCNVYAPSLEARQIQREAIGWTDKFVIGKVGTNVRERKDWVSAFIALSKFKKYHDDVIMYCHTEPECSRGRNLYALRENLEIKDITRFPSLIAMKLTGISDITMNNMYNSLDVYLSNSKGEGFGIPTIEAEAAGVPVIVSDNTAQPELCGGGWILKHMIWEWDEQASWEGKADPDEIVECLEEAYQEKKSGKLAERKMAAREKALEYDIGAVMENHWKPVITEIEEMIKHPNPRQQEPVEAAS